MVVMAMRHQRDVDRRQRIEGDAGVGVAPRPGKGQRRRVIFIARFGSKTADSARDQSIFVLRKLSGPTFLDFWGVRGFNARNLRKDVLFDPPPGPRGRRPTPDSAMRPRAQKCLVWCLGVAPTHI